MRGKGDGGERQGLDRSKGLAWDVISTVAVTSFAQGGPDSEPRAIVPPAAALLRGSAMRRLRAMHGRHWCPDLEPEGILVSGVAVLVGAGRGKGSLGGGLSSGDGSGALVGPHTGSELTCGEHDSDSLAAYGPMHG